MSGIEKAAVIGLGAIGAIYAARIYDVEPEAIEVIVDEARAARYRDNPVVVNGKPYDFHHVTAGVSATGATVTRGTTGTIPLILVAVKYDDLAEAIEVMRPFVGPDTILLSLMNGISSEDILRAAFPANHVLYGMCIAVDAVRENRAVNYSTFGRVVFGDADNSVLSREVEQVRDFFARTDVPCEVPENMLRSLWWKFMINVGINPTSAVLRSPYWVFQMTTEGRALMMDAMREVIAVSQRVGVNLESIDIDNFIPVLESLSPHGKTSMLQDIEAGRKTEVEYLAGTVSELGRKHGVPTPVNDMLFRQVRILERMGEGR